MVQIFNQYFPVKGLLLCLIEAFLIVLGVVSGARIRFWNDSAEFNAFVHSSGLILQLLPVVTVYLISFQFGNLYNFHGTIGRVEELLRIGQSIGAASLFLGLFYFTVPSLLIGRGVFLISMGTIPVFILSNRIILDRTWSFAAPAQNVLILGTHDLARIAATEIRRRQDLNLNLVGVIGNGEAVPSGEIAGYPILGSIDALEQIVAQYDVRRVIVALEDRRGALPVQALVRLRVSGLQVEDAQSTITSLTGRVWLEMVRPSWFVFSGGFHRSRRTLLLKQILDFSLALLLFVLTAPLMLLVAIAIRLDSKGPVLYRQTRVGRKGRHFDVLKFRSMRTDAEVIGGAQWASKNDPRTTRIGRFIRKYRIDELPQVINILKGEMSFVGPRPERPVFVDDLRLKISYYDERHTVRPGLTGWAQVSYPYGSSDEDALRKLEYDLFYLKNLSLFFDCAIVLRTVRIVFTGFGAH